MRRLLSFLCIVGTLLFPGCLDHAAGKARQALDLAGNDDLGGLPVGGGGKGLKRFDADDGVGRGGLVDEQ